MESAGERGFLTACRRWLVPFLILLLFVGFTLSYRYERRPRTRLRQILKTGEITVITRNNAHCYYLYRGQEMGFEYDLARAFADFLGVRINVEVDGRWDEMIDDLLDGRGDVIAASMTITDHRGERTAFSDGYMAVQQHIVVHRNNRSIRTADDLHGQRVHVRKGTTYERRLRALRDAGIRVEVIPHDDLSTEELIRWVSEERITATIADSNIAFLNRRYYPNIVVAEPISEKEYLGWVVSPGAFMLRDRINFFFRKMKATGGFDEIYNRYYADVEVFDYVDMRAFHRRLESRLPRFLGPLRKMAVKHGFDWRLIAAMAYQESHFNPRARSRAGAHGLMQLTRRTARSYGVRQLYDPEENLAAGIRHLRKLYDFFDKARGRDRLFIAMAAYNVGQGHILDARNLARDRDLNPDDWEVLSRMLPLLSERKYYKDAIYGYCRGSEPVRYVQQIMIFYDILRRKHIEYNAATDSRSGPAAEPAPRHPGGDDEG